VKAWHFHILRNRCSPMIKELFNFIVVLILIMILVMRVNIISVHKPQACTSRACDSPRVIRKTLVWDTWPTVGSRNTALHNTQQQKYLHSFSR
jgi:hypothetical protein